MTVSRPFDALSRPPRAYLRQPVPVHFPSELTVPETARHLQLRTSLYLSLRYGFAGRAILTSDQFVYWDPTDPRQCLAPDVALRLGAAVGLLDVWKTWELGAPEVAVEIVSESDRVPGEWERKLSSYRRAGVAEVVRFDPEPRGGLLRLYDLLDGDLVERDPGAPHATWCDRLGLYWVVRSVPELGPALRLAKDPAGELCLPTGEEAERAEKEAERAEKEAERAEKEAALARVRELERELERRR